MSHINHGTAAPLEARIREELATGSSLILLGGPKVEQALRAEPTSVRLRWTRSVEADVRKECGSGAIGAIVLSGTDRELHEDAGLVLALAELWRRANLIVVEHADDPFGHGIALEIAQIVGGEITIDSTAQDEPFAWIESPETRYSPPALEYPNVVGVLPEGMVVPPPIGAGNDYSFIQNAVEAQEEMPNSPISVVIPLYNRRDVLAKTLACLLHQTYPRELIEVVIADDGSSDDPLEIIETFLDRLDIRYVWQPDEGYRLSGIRNLGVRSARHNDVILLDCDMAPVPRMVELYARYLNANRNAVYMGHRRYVDANDLTADDLLASPAPILRLSDIVTGNPLEKDDEQGKPTIDWRIPIYQRTNDLRHEQNPFRTVCGGNIAFDRKIFDLAGPFDEDFTAWGAEDAEWGFRIWNRGVYLVPILGACGLHQEPLGGRNETDREAGRQQTHPMFVDRCPVHYRKSHDDGEVHIVPLVSIYIPAYNAADTIAAAVDSALAQSITDLEVCIVDDGSTDDTCALLAERYDGNPRVRWQRQPNGGIGAASNAAVRMCRGAFIGQLDADDLLKTNAVEVLLRHIQRDTRYGLAYGAYELIDGNGLVTEKGWEHPEFSREELIKSMIVHHFRLFRARDWYRTSGFDEHFLNAVDYDMFLKLAEVTEVIHARRVLYQYRLDGSSTSIKHRDKQIENHMLVVEAALRRLDLSQDWRITTPDPNMPRKIVYEPRGSETAYGRETASVSSRIVVEGPLEGNDHAVLNALRAERPSWTWRSETQRGAKRFRIVGPRIRTSLADDHCEQLKRALDPTNEHRLAFSVFDAESFPAPPAQRRKNRANAAR